MLKSLYQVNLNINIDKSSQITNLPSVQVFHVQIHVFNVSLGHECTDDQTEWLDSTWINQEVNPFTTNSLAKVSFNLMNVMSVSIFHPFDSEK